MRHESMTMGETKNPFDDESKSDAPISISGINQDHGMSPSSLSSLFPAGLSSWMTTAMTSFASPSRDDNNRGKELVLGTGAGNDDNDDDGDESLYHDCNSSLTDTIHDSSSLEDVETTRLLPSRKAQHHLINSSQQNLSPLHSQRDNFYHASSSATPIRDNHGGRSRSNDDIAAEVGNNDHDEANPNDSQHSITSPLAHALATWLSPYANSAKRAGRKYTSFMGIQTTVGHDEKSHCNDVEEDDVAYDQESPSHAVRFHSDCKKNGSGRSSTGLLSRVHSSPALMTSASDETSNFGESEFGKYSSLRPRSDSTTIVLKEIHVQSEHYDSEYGTVMHPWTKLIVLEELGTAWSWFVLLLPYVVLILAVILDGDAKLKSTVVGPLHGTISCADLVGGSIPTPYDASVKGYFPVPFRFVEYNASQSNATMAEATLHGSCSYLFELREGVGLLSRGQRPESTTTLSPRTSIVEPRYRFIMSHGHAFTSGVISNVPPTAQSLSGSASFKNLSSNAVSLVASGSVMVSVIVFQRPVLSYDGILTNNDTMSDKNEPWSPVLILGSKRLEMMCKLNGKHNEVDSDARTWNCGSSGIIDAYFSLPNAAVLIGGDLRVDVLLVAHRKIRQEDGHGGSKGTDDDYIVHDINDDIALPEEEKILLTADTSHPQQLLEELTTKSVFKIEHESVAYDKVIEGTRILLLTTTIMFLCYWQWKMHSMNEDTYTATVKNGATSRGRTITHTLRQTLSNVWCRNDERFTRFWWQDPWVTFPERRYLLGLLFCLVMLQNPLLSYAFFDPSLYSSPRFRFAADSISSISVHGILFLWLCLVQGLRYHTADIARRRFDQHRRVLELRKATRHIAPTDDIEDHQWGQVRWYYQQYGDVDGGGNAYSMALMMKHDFHSDSFVEFIFPKITLLLLGVVASLLAAASRFPKSVSNSTSERIELNPDRFGSGSKVYVFSCIVQIVVIQIWCICIVHASFVTGERLRREPFLSTRPAQLAFRVLSGILLLGLGFCIGLFYFQSLNLTGSEGTNISYATISGDYDDSLDSKAELWIKLIRRATTEIPFIGTASNIGPGKIMYATSCSLVVAYMFLPSSHFDSSNKDKPPGDIPIGSDHHSKQNVLSDMADMIKRYQGKDKRSVVALARNTHTWRVFPLPTRSHGYLSQHTLKEKLNMIGTFQLKVDGRHFTLHHDKFGQGTIYKGLYIPVFCCEIACWLLEASWQAYYSPMEYSLNSWAPGRMRLDSIGLKLDHAIHDSETDTHGFVASNISEQVEGEEDSIIVVAFRGSASMSNIIETDLSFRQVPLPEKMMSDTPAFNIRPGLPVVVDETAWDTNISLPSILKDILRPPSGQKISSLSTFPSVSSIVDNADLDTPHMPTVSTGAKEIIRATPMARQALPCVHEGFLRNYSRVRHELIEAILSVFKRQLDKSVERSRLNSQPLTLPKLYITGHSMGGAFAQLLAIDLASNCEIAIEQSITSERIHGSDAERRNRTSSLDDIGVAADKSISVADSEIFWFGPKLRQKRAVTRLRPPIAVYTYGQPRLGNNAFKTIYKRRVPHTFRVATEGDAITSMLTVGPFCGGIYRHAGLEVLLEESCTGNILVGPTVVETLLRFTKVRTSVAAHSLEKYRESLESALGRDELKEYYRGHGGKVRHDSQGGAHGGNLPAWVTNVKRSNEV